MVRRLIAIFSATLLLQAAAAAQDNPAATYVPKPSPVAAVDTTKVLCIGNSFTYFHDCPHKLVEIAAFEGHFIDMTWAFRGGYTLGQHVTYQPTVEAIRKGGYEYAFLQDQSQAAARYVGFHDDYPYVRTDFETLSACVRTVSRDCECIYERTWSYPAFENGGFPTEKEFDKALAKGARKVARPSGSRVSPIGDAFTLSRELYPEINLLYTDSHHQSPAGTYLKCCVNYLMIFKQPFGSSPSDCDLDPATAAKLRSVAEKIVFKK